MIGWIVLGVVGVLIFAFMFLVLLAMVSSEEYMDE
jgi:hypothetical protein